MKPYAFHSSFAHVTNAIQWMYTPKQLTAIRALEDLISLRSEAVGLDDAIGSALARLNSKLALPAMAQLLESRDPIAQLRAASFFGKFALFADAHGNISGTQGGRAILFRGDQSRDASTRLR